MSPVRATPGLSGRAIIAFCRPNCSALRTADAVVNAGHNSLKLRRLRACSPLEANEGSQDSFCRW